MQKIQRILISSLSMNISAHKVKFFSFENHTTLREEISAELNFAVEKTKMVDFRGIKFCDFRESIGS